MMSTPMLRAALPRAHARSFPPCALGAPAQTPAAINDDDPDPANAALLRAALRLRLGLGPSAASHAREQGERAFFAGDNDAYRWWRQITRTLDRAMVADRLGRLHRRH
jgi:hypothetical protein